MRRAAPRLVPRAALEPGVGRRPERGAECSSGRSRGGRFAAPRRRRGWIRQMLRSTLAVKWLAMWPTAAGVPHTSSSIWAKRMGARSLAKWRVSLSVGSAKMNSGVMHQRGPFEEGGSRHVLAAHQPAGEIAEQAHDGRRHRAHQKADAIALGAPHAAPVAAERGDVELAGDRAHCCAQGRWRSRPGCGRANAGAGRDGAAAPSRSRRRYRWCTSRACGRESRARSPGATGADAAIVAGQRRDGRAPPA